MEDLELKDLWKSYDQKLEEARVLNMQSWVLNLRSFETLQLLKAKSKMNSLAKLKWVMVAGGIVWAGILLYLVAHSLTYPRVYFAVSAGMIALFTLLAIVIYIRHIILIRQIDNSESIVDTQKKLARLQTSTIKSTRILWLQMPFYSTFFYSTEFLSDIKSWFIAVPITLLLTGLSIWLFRNIQPANTGKKWFKLIMGGPELDAVSKALFFVNEIEEFKKNSE